MIDPDDPPRWWTPEEADSVLPRVTELANRAKAAMEALAELNAEVAELGRTNGHGGPLAYHRAELDEVVSALDEEGILLRDPLRGLVDFPARAPVSGRGYWLCWLVGEPRVAWWHWPDAGFAGRTPLDRPPD
jgi:hypothetical protein